MNWFALYPRGHHGYPQQADTYFERTFRDSCPHCGWHGAQVAPFRFSSRNSALHLHFVQLNWVFDVFFVTPEVAADIAVAGITGVTFSDALHNRTGTPLRSRVQLCCPDVRPAALVAELPSISCRAHNEESHLRLNVAETEPGVHPYCGRTKSHPPTTLGLASASLLDAPDVFLTAEWFGSGGSAWRHTIVSERFVELICARPWRGVRAEAVQYDVQSQLNSRAHWRQIKPCTRVTLGE
jgi:hypothetical protein